MQIVLRKDLDKVGKRGDIVSVSDGFARNYLIPRGHAIKATDGIEKQANAMRAARDRADLKNKESAEALAAKLAEVSIRIEANVGAEGKLFGSVTPHDIVEAIKKDSGIELDRRQFELHEPIRTVGTHKVEVRLHIDVRPELTVEVVASDA